MLADEVTPREQLTMLLSIHDGDDRCRCLARCVETAVDAETKEAAMRELDGILRTCLADHPAGGTWRRRMVDGLESGRESG